MGRMVAKVRIGYLQQGLGAADLFAALYFGELRLKEDDPTGPDAIASCSPPPFSTPPWPNAGWPHGDAGHLYGRRLAL